MKKYQLKNIDCASCAAKIEKGLSKLEQVNYVNVNFANSTMTIDTNDIEKVKQKIKELEPEVEVEDSILGIHPFGKKKSFVSTSELAENKWTIIKAVSALFLLLSGIIFEKEIHNTPYHIAEYAVFITAYLITGWKVITKAIKNIFRGKIFDENFLMTIATLGAFAIDGDLVAIGSNGADGHTATADGDLYVVGDFEVHGIVDLDGSFDFDGTTFDVDASGLLSLTSSLDAAQAVLVEATAGGIDIAATT
ncbi:MAG: hypothetical protein COZ25_03195, partial [Ignavibacteria bacterium CG_4_10_14_3_um_filter_37_18]